MTAQESAMSEPREPDCAYECPFTEQAHKDGFADHDFIATLDAIEEQAATEARRELLAKVDSVRQRLADRGQPQNPEWARLVRESIEEQP